MGNSFDVIVIGIGAMGSAACCHLAGRGIRVLGLDQFDIPNTHGSSGGFSRMTRMAYQEHPDYVPLLKSAFSLWHELEAEAGHKLIYVTGGLYMGPPEGSSIDGALQSAKTHDLPYEMLDRAELRRRYPQFQVPENFVAMLERNAGLILSEKAIAAHAMLAMRRGAELHGQEKVISWTEDAAGVSVTTSRDTYHANQLLFCGGAWTEKLVRNLGIPLRVTRQVLGWVWPKKPELFEMGRIPVWLIDSQQGGPIHYGFPMLPENPGFKLAYHCPGQTTDPDKVIRSPLPGDEETFRSLLKENIPDADGPLLSLRVCMYTNSPDGHFIIDRHPHHSRVLLACGFSGHGFKFATVLGQALADLIAQGKTRHAIEFLGLSRGDC